MTASVASLVVGAALGSYATAALFGSSETVNVNPQKAPPAEPCRCEIPMPEPVDPLATSRVGEGITEIDAPRLPGLPRSALELATRAAHEQFGPCATSSAAVGQGTLILELTVTATGGQGFVKDGGVVDRTGETEWAEQCMMRRLPAVRFEWSGGDGQQTLKLPLRVGTDDF